MRNLIVSLILFLSPYLGYLYGLHYVSEVMKTDSVPQNAMVVAGLITVLSVVVGWIGSIIFLIIGIKNIKGSDKTNNSLHQN